MNGRISIDDFVDTYPTAPAEFDRLVSHLEGTNIPLPTACRGGSCRQGREVCHTPVACQVHADLDAKDGIQRGVFAWPIAALAVLICALVAWGLAS